MSEIVREVAEQEVQKWLDYKKVSERKQEANKDHIETLIDAFQEATLVLNEDSTITHKLKFPTDGDKPVTQLVYKPRLKMHTVHLHMQGVKAADGDGRVCAYVAALTSQTKELIKGLDTEDYTIAQAIAIFFL